MRTCAAKVQLPSECRISHSSQSTYFDAVALVWIGWLMILIAAAFCYVKKAEDGQSAFIRWRPQVLQLISGVNIYDTKMFPNPPIMPLTLYPLMSLPPVAGALCWFVVKAALTGISVWLCFQGYGMFLWAGVVLYLATAWRVWRESGRVGGDGAWITGVWRRDT
jgi:hypothetical protein